MPKPTHRKRADGSDCWRVRFQLNRTTTSATFDSERAAEKFCTLVDTVGPVRALELLDEGTVPVDAAPGRTMDAVFERYMGWKSRKNKRGEYVGKVKTDRTLADNRRDYANWLQPWFGDRDIDTITEVDVAQWIEAMEGRLSAKTIADRHSLLHQIYKWASSGSRAITVNDPCRVTELPARTKRQPKGLKPAEWALLHQAAHEVDPDAADLLLFFVASGWRWSEATALAVWEVELDEHGRVFVNMGRVVRRNAAGEHVIVADAKSLAGERRIKMGAAAGEMLLRRIDGKRPDDLVFTSGSGGRWSYSHFSGNIWHRAKGAKAKRVRILERAQELGLERADQVTLHWLRHTHVGMLILGGNVSLPEIQRRVGHASINTTINVYGRMVDDVSDDALEALDAMLGVGQPPAAVEGPVVAGEIVR